MKSALRVIADSALRYALAEPSATLSCYLRYILKMLSDTGAFQTLWAPPISSQGRPDASHMVKGVFKGGTLCHVKGATLGHRWRPYAPKAPTVHDELHIIAKLVYMRVEAYLRGNIVFSWALGPALKAPS